MASLKCGDRRAKLSLRYPCARHGWAIAWAMPIGETGGTMAAVSNLWKGMGKGEKVPILLLALCIAVLVAILVFRPIW